MADNTKEKIEENNERRQFFRLDMEKELVDIIWTNSAGQKNCKKIVCVDFSKGGLKLDCDQSIPLHTDVIVRFKGAAENSQIIKGKIVRCLAKDTGWFELAIQLSD